MTIREQKVVLTIPPEGPYALLRHGIDMLEQLQTGMEMEVADVARLLATLALMRDIVGDTYNEILKRAQDLGVMVGDPVEFWDGDKKPDVTAIITPATPRH